MMINTRGVDVAIPDDTKEAESASISQGWPDWGSESRSLRRGIDDCVRDTQSYEDGRSVNTDESFEATRGSPRQPDIRSLSTKWLIEAGSVMDDRSSQFAAFNASL